MAPAASPLAPGRSQLTLGPPAGIHERAAERAAEQVVDRHHAGPDRTDGLHGSRERPSTPRASEPRAAATESHGAAPPAASTPVAPELTAAIRQQEGEGAPLPAAIRRTMESSYGVSFARVRVHADQRSADLNKALGAAAFTTGRHLFFRQGGFDPQSRKGQKLIAHELAHVVQQGAAPPQPAVAAGPDLAPDWKGAEAASLSALPAPAPDGAPGSLIQRQFQGPQFPLNKYHNGNYPGHSLTFPGGARPQTGCGKKNVLKTDGSQYSAGAKSDPGDPTNFPLYRDGYSRPGGLVRDKNRPQTSTRMHLINHHFDTTAGANGTQQNAENILLGSQRSNKAHCLEVETPVKNAIRTHGTYNNNLYEAAMGSATQTTDAATKTDNVLFWGLANPPHNNAVKNAQIQGAWLQKNNAATGVDANKQHNTDAKGFALKVDANTPGQHYRHLWVEYEVAASYTGRPAYVNANIQHETDQNTDPLGQPIDANIDAHITTFTKKWSNNAFPPRFTCKAKYYSATYDPWQKIYQVETEKHTITTDQ
jgi:hypothetical protein